MQNDISFYLSCFFSKHIFLEKNQKFSDLLALLDLLVLALLVFASLTCFAWQSFARFDLLAKLAHLLVLDFEQLLSFFLQNIKIFLSMIFWKKIEIFRFLIGLLALLGFL